jgi:hypothetical protein
MMNLDIIKTCCTTGTFVARSGSACQGLASQGAVRSGLVGLGMGLKARLRLRLCHV